MTYNNNQSFTTPTQQQNDDDQLDYLGFVAPTRGLDIPTSGDRKTPLHFTSSRQENYSYNTIYPRAMYSGNTMITTQGSFETPFQPMFDSVTIHGNVLSPYQEVGYSSLPYPSYHDIHQARDEPQPSSSQKPRQVLPRECSLCDQTSTSNRDLNRHLWSKHPIYAAATGVPSQQSPCTVPGCTYNGRKDNLLRHMRLKH